MANNWQSEAPWLRRVRRRWDDEAKLQTPSPSINTTTVITQKSSFKQFLDIFNLRKKHKREKNKKEIDKRANVSHDGLIHYYNTMV